MKTVFKIIYWLLSFTWGLLMSFIGLIVTCVVILKGGKIHKNGCSIIIEISNNWGGLSLGCFVFCANYNETNSYWFEHTRKHEFGHSLQNIILGPLFIFIVAIPSVIRYHYKNYCVKYNKKQFDVNWYDSIWFEGTATKYGTKLIDWLENKKRGI